MLSLAQLSNEFYTRMAHRQVQLAAQLERGVIDEDGEDLNGILRIAKQIESLMRTSTTCKSISLKRPY